MLSSENNDNNLRLSIRFDVSSQALSKEVDVVFSVKFNPLGIPDSHTKLTGCAYESVVSAISVLVVSVFVVGNDPVTGLESNGLLNGELSQCVLVTHSHFAVAVGNLGRRQNLSLETHRLCLNRDTPLL